MVKTLQTQVEIAQDMFNNASKSFSQHIETYIKYILKDMELPYHIYDLVTTSNGLNGWLKSRTIFLDENSNRLLISWYDVDTKTFEISYLTDEELKVQQNLYEYFTTIQKGNNS